MKRWNVLSILAGLGLFVSPLLARAEEPAAAAPTTETKPEVKSEAKIEDYVGYDKGFYIQSADGKFRLLTTGYIQEQFSALFKESAIDDYNIKVRRARLKFSGNLFSKDVQYELEYDFSTSKLLNAFGQLVHCDAFKFRFGQYYVPFDFENQASSSNLQFIERSISNAFFGIAEQREPGLGANGVFGDKKWEYDIGMFNGEGINTNNANKSFRYAGRMVYNIAGHHGYEYADIKPSDTPQIAFGTAAMYNDTPDAATIPVGGTVAAFDKVVTSLTGDLSAKYRGLDASGEFLFQRTNPETGSPTNGGAKTYDKGWVVQGGYMLMPETLEVAARVAHVYVDSGKDLGEYTAGLNYYIYGGHRVKFQVNYSLLTTEDGIAVGNDRLDHQALAQLQLKI